MNKQYFARSACLACAALAVASGAAALSDAAEPPSLSPFAKWEPAIAVFEEQDAKSPPPKGGVVFVGSSSIRLWDLSKSFPKLDAVNRGFGGSEVADSVHFAQRLVLKHKPRQVVLYAGDNDIAHGKSAEQVAADFREFVQVILKELPETKITYVATKPSIARWKLADTIRQANSLIRQQVEQDESLSFVDVWPAMLGEDGRPRPELFVKDGLHLSAAGYELWTKLLQPHLTDAEPARD
jgi:lysophospholipase L1-like esterase